MKRKKKRPRLADESARKEVELVGGEKFYIGTYLPIIDSLQTEHSMRKASYDVIEQRFGFICALQTEEISEGCKALTHAYPGHFDDEMEHEMMQFFNYAKEPLQKYITKVRESKKQTQGKERVSRGKGMKEQELKEISTGQFLLNLFRNNNTQATFLNVMIALRLLLTLPCSVASGERSFSILKRVKNQFRSTMSQERNVALCLMASNTDILRKLDVQKLSRKFALTKARKHKF